MHCLSFSNYFVNINHLYLKHSYCEIQSTTFLLYLFSSTHLNSITVYSASVSSLVEEVSQGFLLVFLVYSLCLFSQYSPLLWWFSQALICWWPLNMFLELLPSFVDANKLFKRNICPIVISYNLTGHRSKKISWQSEVVFEKRYLELDIQLWKLTSTSNLSFLLLSLSCVKGNDNRERKYWVRRNEECVYSHQSRTSIMWTCNISRMRE